MKAAIPEKVSLSKVDIWFQDESRIGQQGSLTRIWHTRGERPRVVKQQQFISSYIYGAVCPKTGESVALILPFADKEGMKLHLEEISRNIKEGRHGVVVMDRASWHQ